MKQKRNLCGKVLPTLILLTVTLSSVFTGNAQVKYRGFVEGGLGMAFVKGASYSYGSIGGGGGVGLGYMFATTHGIQTKNNFFGIGFGITPGYYAMGNWASESRETKASFPLYLNWRYDFFGTNGLLRPYLGVKAGAYIPLREFVYADNDGSIPFFAIDFGFRKRISESSGVSFGLSIQSSNDAYFDIDNGDDVRSIGPNILAKVSFDF